APDVPHGVRAGVGQAALAERAGDDLLDVVRGEAALASVGVTVPQDPRGPLADLPLARQTPDAPEVLDLLAGRLVHAACHRLSPLDSGSMPSVDDGGAGQSV